MRNQVELSFFVGYPERIALFEERVIKLASKLCGGCTVVDATGYWTEDGALHRYEFSGPAESEHCFYLKLTCEVEKEERVMQHMQAGISAFAKYYCVETDWVHVQRVEFTGMHFSINKRPTTPAPWSATSCHPARFAHS